MYQLFKLHGEYYIFKTSDDGWTMCIRTLSEKADKKYIGSELSLSYSKQQGIVVMEDADEDVLLGYYYLETL